jgi:hypothetical protein
VHRRGRATTGVGCGRCVCSALRSLSAAAVQRHYRLTVNISCRKCDPHWASHPFFSPLLHCVPCLAAPR